MIFLVYSNDGELTTLPASEINAITIFFDDPNAYCLAMHHKCGERHEIEIDGCKDVAEANKVLLAVLFEITSKQTGFVMLDIVIKEYREIYRDMMEKYMLSNIDFDSGKQLDFEIYLKGE